jgi:phosphatidylethanolamine-binding protein (PEBP) family uncharacterized protein
MFEKLPESLGRVLQGQRSGIENIAFRHLLLNREVPRIAVRSGAFDNMGAIPVQFTADGDGVSPPLEWASVPSATTCVALIVEDADSPTAHPLVHAIAVIGAGLGRLQTGALPTGDGAGSGVEMGLNSFLRRSWLPPDPPPGHGPHRYAFQLFALGEGAASFSHALGRQELMETILNRAIAAGCLIGTYERARRQNNEETEETDKDVEISESDSAAPSVA